MNINRNQIIEAFFRIINHISDKNYQYRIWIRGEGPEVDDFDETICNFFNIGDPILDDYKKFRITESQYKIIKEFRDRFRDFADENDLPEEFIHTPEWGKIMEMAKEVLKVFNYINSSR